MTKKLYVVLAAVAVALSLGAILLWTSQTEVPETKVAASGAMPTKMTVFKSPTCGCCGGWVGYLRQHGLDVTVRDQEDVSPVKERYGVPDDMWSCHTAVIGRYVIEGHVPFAAIERLFAEQPDIKGIALPGMLEGSPGMPGDKDETFVIYGFSDAGSSVFMEM